MKIAILNGSPKGNTSVTMQYVLFMQKKFPHLNLTIHHVAQRINKIVKDEHYFQLLLGDIRASDAVIWAFPVYFLLVPSQYKRFIELVFERREEAYFMDKYAVSLSTSIHVFDHTAHNYIHAVCDDLNMRYVGDYSAKMYDLLRKKERQRFLLFTENFQADVKRCAPSVKVYPPLKRSAFTYVSGEAPPSIDTGEKRMLIITDTGSDDTNLAGMISALKKQYLQDVEVINLHNIDISGGCLGCISCGYNNNCVYFGNDGYRDFYEEKVKTADAIVMAGSMKDRYLSSRWKMFFDRSFYNNHKPVLKDKQVGFLISGPLSQNYNLRQVLAGYLENMGANLVGFVTDEPEDSAFIDAHIHDFAQRLSHLAIQNYLKPLTFLGVGGKKILQDEIWGSLRFVFLADHRYYKKHGFYRFPQKDYHTRIRNVFMTLLMSIPAIRKNIQKRINDEAIKPLQYVVKNK